MTVDGPKRSTGSRRIVWVLQRGEQPILMGIVVICVLCIGLRVYQTWRIGNGVVDFDELSPQPAGYAVDINSADWPEFANLPGIGEVLGREIVGYRQRQGPFASIDQLLDVPGIGEKKLERLRPMVYLRPGHDSPMQRK